MITRGRREGEVEKVRYRGRGTRRGREERRLCIEVEKVRYTVEEKR